MVQDKVSLLGARGHAQRRGRVSDPVPNNDVAIAKQAGRRGAIWAPPNQRPISVSPMYPTALRPVASATSIPLAPQIAPQTPSVSSAAEAA